MKRVSTHRVHAVSAARQSAPLPYPRRGLFSLARTALAEVHSLAQAGRNEPNDQEYDFAKRTQLSYVKSVVCVFQSQRKQGVSEDIRCKRRGGTRPGRPQHRNLAHRKESCRVATRVTWNKHFDRTLTQLERSQRVRKGQPLSPQVDVKIS
jgi:hypothetical protein